MNKDNLKIIIESIIGIILLIAFIIVFFHVAVFIIGIALIFGIIYYVYYKFIKFKNKKSNKETPKKDRLGNVVMDAEYKEK